MKYVIKKAGEPRTDSYWATVGDAGNIDCYHVWGSREAAAEFASEADARLLARSIQRGRSDDLVLEVCLVDVAIDAMSGLTSQPSLGAMVANLAGSRLDTGLDPRMVGPLNSYWETVTWRLIMI